ncbi:hypothetical protein pb186bvf_005008 [Paramecium bursaria]
MQIGAPKQCKLQPIQPCCQFSNIDLDLFDLERDYFFIRLDEIKHPNQCSRTFLKGTFKSRNRSTSILTNGSQILKSRKKLKNNGSHRRVRFSLSNLEY